MENDVHKLKWKIIRQTFEIARLEDKVKKLEQEITRANAKEIVSLYFDGYPVRQAIELIKNKGVVECRTASLDAAAHTSNAQMPENV